MRNFFILLFMLISLSLTAQQYNNEWINFSQTYYKFKVWKAGIYRIPQSVLAAAGLGNAPVQNLELWRNGAKVALYTSVPSGPLPGDGYLEFWGELNDGKPDKALYLDPAFQHTDKTSLLSDTSVYFLSVSTNANNFQVREIPNDVDGPKPAEEPYLMYTTGFYFKDRANFGYAAVLPEYVYSSSYDEGEFKSSLEISPQTNFNRTFSNLFAYTGGPGGTLRYGAAGNANNARSVRIQSGSTVLNETVMDFFNDLHTSVPIASSQLASGSLQITAKNTSAVATDRMVVSYFELEYPRQFNFNNSKNVPFKLPPKTDGYYLRISNFGTGGVAPVLYDLNSAERFVGNIAEAGRVRFVLPGSAAERRLVLVSEEASNINSIGSLTPKNFINFKDDASRHGEYIIITHPLFFNGSNGNNPIVAYKQYRESAPGGGFKNVQIVEIGELIDQFAFGINHHPSSIKNYLSFARRYFTRQLQFVFLIGRGVTYSDYFYGTDPVARERLSLIPTFGYPGSDNMLAAEGVQDPFVVTPIGRLSAISTTEVEDYLEKVKEYESAQQNLPQTLAGREWMKNVVHVTGSSDPSLGKSLCEYMGVYKDLIEDTLYGGKVSTFCKVSTNSVEQLTSQALTKLFAEGISLLTYFGHSSATTLEFNIDNPNNYSNQGKYPVFCVNGCNAGNFFTYAPERLVANETLSEKFVLAKQRGSIAFIASTHLGIVNFLNTYLKHLYTVMAHTDYGKTLGETNRDALRNMVNAAGLDHYSRMHAEQITLHGDPALRLNGQPQPDYVMEQSLIKVNPSFISVAETGFQLKVRMVNIGKASADSISVEVKRTFPDGSTASIYKGRIRGIMYQDSLSFEVPIVATRDKGLNKITVTLDVDHERSEISEDNNTDTREFFIYEEEARPVYPYTYSIINEPSTKFYASTANPFSQMREYVMEIDTTENFNSPLKTSAKISATGGLLEFSPTLSFIDSTVYYWRVSTVPPSGGQYQWNNASFTYLAGNSTGFGQGHYFQHLNSTVSRIKLEPDRKWNYEPHQNHVFIKNGVFPKTSDQQQSYEVVLNGNLTLGPGCAYNDIIFNVIDPVTFRPWQNNFSGATGLYKSNKLNCGSRREYNFVYTTSNATGRKNAMDFMALIPAGYYVIVRSNASPQTTNQDCSNCGTINTFVNKWKDDTTALGSGNSLYHALYNTGFADLDSFSRPRAYSYMYKKADPAFAPVWLFSNGVYDPINLTVFPTSKDSLGYISSPKFGPAAEWHEVIWRGSSLESPTHDNPQVEVYGINNNNAETLLYTLDKDTRNFDVSAVVAKQFPYMRLRLRNADSIDLTPFQLKYWHIRYTPVPEGAVAPNLGFSTKDTVEVGEPLSVAVAFKNISKPAFDSIVVKVQITDRNNVTRTLTVPKQKPLVSGDTAMVRVNIDTKDFLDNNTLYLDVNPDNAQPEQYHFNNFLYRNFYVKGDKLNPLLDVTFDGIHILNRDIVSAKPHIQMKLKDESKYLLLNDTSLNKVQIKYPDNTLRDYHFDNDTLRFTPATSGNDNSATVDFFPQFLNQQNPEGEEYELIVKSKDKSGNAAGSLEYRIAFKVITKPMISNLLNYPNPFSTSTAFVFTLTGSELPQNLKVQILTITGKIVREITMQELGPLHIGRNITEFKWDGTDQYGSKLANGVYLYRVVTTLNGKQMDKYRAEGDNTDKFFTNGYGKMYLMR